MRIGPHNRVRGHLVRSEAFCETFRNFYWISVFLRQRLTDAYQVICGERLRLLHRGRPQGSLWKIRSYFGTCDNKKLRICAFWEERRRRNRDQGATRIRTERQCHKSINVNDSAQDWRRPWWWWWRQRASLLQRSWQARIFTRASTTTQLGLWRSTAWQRKPVSPVLRQKRILPKFIPFLRQSRIRWVWVSIRQWLF